MDCDAIRYEHAEFVYYVAGTRMLDLIERYLQGSLCRKDGKVVMHTRVVVRGLVYAPPSSSRMAV